MSSDNLCTVQYWYNKLACEKEAQLNFSRGLSSLFSIFTSEELDVIYQSSDSQAKAISQMYLMIDKKAEGAM